MDHALFTRSEPWLAAIIAAGGLGLAAGANAQEHGHDLARLGTVEFNVECNADARREFDHAMALYHSFAWKEALGSFAAATEADPTCGFGHWGRAMGMLDNPFLWSGLSPEMLDAASAALQQAREAGSARAPCARKVGRRTALRRSDR